MLAGKRIFVLASGSFSGSHFVDACLALGAQVQGTSRSAETSPAFLPYLKNPARKNFQFFQNNLNSDLNFILKRMAEFEPHYVVDFAGQGMVAQSWQAPQQWFETNVLSKVKLHEGLRQFKFLEGYLRFSTPEVYGSTGGMVREDAPMNPSTPYAVSHAAIDMSLMTYARRYKFPVILTRTTNVYGIGQQLYRIIPRAVLSARAGKMLTLDGGGVSVRNFIDIRDVSWGLIALLTKPEAAGQIFHLSTDEYVSIRSLVEKVATLTKVPFERFVTVGAERPGKDHSYEIDSQKIRQLTGWAPRVSLDTGLRQVISWVDENRAELENMSWDYIHKH